MSAFIVNQAFTDLIISTMVEQKYYGTKESQEKYLQTVLKIRESFYFLRAQYETDQVDEISLDSTERGLNNAVEYLKEILENK
jgi:hypothetical protein